MPPRELLSLCTRHQSIFLLIEILFLKNHNILVMLGRNKLSKKCKHTYICTYVIIWSMAICGALSVFTTCCQWLSLFWASLQALFSLKFPDAGQTPVLHKVTYVHACIFACIHTGTQGKHTGSTGLILLLLLHRERCLQLLLYEQEKSMQSFRLCKRNAG